MTFLIKIFKIIKLSGFFFYSSVQFSLVAQSYPTLCKLICSTPGLPVLHCFLGLLKFMSTESVMLSDHLILCCSLLLNSILPSIRAFSSESALHIGWPKYWSFSISPYKEYSGLISSRINWFEFLAVQ